MADRTVTVSLQARVAGYIAQMQAAGRATAEVGTMGAATAQKVGLVSPALLGIGTAAALVGAKAVSTFANFDQAMSGVASSTGETAAQMDKLRQAAIDAGGATQYSATEAANAINEMAKAGVSSADILGGGLTGSLALAAAGQMDVADAAGIAATAMQIFGLSGQDIPHIADLLSAGANKAMGSVSDMGQALGNGGLLASQFGMSIEETVGVLAQFAQAGLVGAEGGTQLRSMLMALASPSKAARDTMADLGISVYDAGGQFVGMADLAGQLQSKLGEVDAATRNTAMATIFGSYAIQGANILYKDGADVTSNWAKEVNVAGDATKRASTLTDNLKGDVEKLTGALDTLFITTADGTNGPLRGLVQALTDVTEAIGAAQTAGEKDSLLGLGPLSSIVDVAKVPWDKRPRFAGGEGFPMPWEDTPAPITITSPSYDPGVPQAYADAQRDVAASAADVAAGEKAAADATAAADSAYQNAMNSAFGYLGAKLTLAGASRDMLGIEDELRAGMYQTTTAAGTASKARTGMSKAERKELNDDIAALRKKDKAAEDAEVKAAQRRAKAAAEKRADAGARKDVREGVKKAIDTDKAAKAGQDINGKNQGNSVGEAAGSLTDKESKALDAKVKAIRDKHQTALDAQIKGMEKAAKGADAAAGATGRASGATTTYSASLDENTTAGRHNLEMIDSQVAEHEAAAQRIGQAVLDSGGTVGEATKAVQDYLLKWVDAFTDGAEGAGFARAEVEKYLAKLDLIDSVITTLFEIDTTPAEKAMAKLMAKWKKEYDWTSTGHGPTAPVPTKPLPAPTKPRTQDPKTGEYRAFGGEVYGPGGPRSDSVQLRASAGEYVVNAQQYAANRDLVRAINGGTGRVSGGGGGSPLVGSMTVVAAKPEQAGDNVIDKLAEYGYRNGVR